MTTPGYRNYNPRYTTSNSLTSLASHRVEHSWSEIMSELQMLLMQALLFHAIKTQLQACLETCFYGIDPVSKVPPIRALYLDNLDQWECSTLTSLTPDYEQEAFQRGGLLLPARPLQVCLSVGDDRQSTQSSLLQLLLLLGPGQTQHLLIRIFNILLTTALPCTDQAGNILIWKIIISFLGPGYWGIQIPSQNVRVGNIETFTINFFVQEMEEGEGRMESRKWNQLFLHFSVYVGQQ